jgi:curved DNA-binding protein CbpA
MSRQEDFIDYYAVLQVWPTASEAIIKKAYFSLAKLHHPDVSSRDGNGDGDSSVDFKMINEAYNVLIDPVKRREYDESFKRYGRTGQGKREADKRSAQLAYEQAKTSIKHERYDKAAVLLRSAIKYDDSNPLYCSWYGFCLAALNTNLHEARDYCKKALEMEFFNPEFHANLGFVYHQAGLTSTALESFREALKWDPEHPLALKYLYNADKNGKSNIIGGLKSLFRRSHSK